MSLVQRVNMFLNEAINLSSPFEELRELTEEMYELKSRLNKPLRVAIVGVIKAGKSTLMNALMGEKLVITGNVETTYTPTWFKYSKKPGITVKMDDGSEREGALKDITYWTVRNSSNPELGRVQYVVIKSNNPFLKDIELIDTPGIESYYIKDSINTLKFVGLDKNDMNEVTMNEASLADAIVYAFSRGMGTNDEEILKAFQGPLFANATPINALGVLTKVDDYWSAGYEDPLKESFRIVDNYRHSERVKSVLYTVLPVIGRIAENRNCMEERDMEILKALSSVESNRFRRLILSEERFCEREYEDVAVCPKDREYIWKKLGQYGVNLGVSALQKGIGAEEIGEYLYQNSGIGDLMNIIKHHFGNRSYIIKLQYCINRIKNRCFSLLNNNARGKSSLINALDCILTSCEKLEADEHSFAELKVLQNYYNGTLRMYDDDEIKEMLQITGEDGHYCEARMGVPEGTPVKELTEIARNKAEEWNLKANDGMNTRQYEEAARVLARSCEIMYYHLSYLV